MTVSNKFVTYPGNTTGSFKVYQKIDEPYQKVQRPNNTRYMNRIRFFFHFVDNSSASSMQRKIIIIMFSKYKCTNRLKLGNRSRRGEAETGEKITDRTHCLCKLKTIPCLLHLMI